MDDDTPQLLRSHFEDPYHRGDCDRGTCSAQAHDAGSGHFVAMQLRIDADLVEEAWFDAAGCWQCEAPASILAQFCEGKSIAALTELESAFFLELTQLDHVNIPSSCQPLAWTALQRALQSFDSGMDATDDRPLFGGPSLSEES